MTNVRRTYRVENPNNVNNNFESVTTRQLIYLLLLIVKKKDVRPF